MNSGKSDMQIGECNSGWTNSNIAFIRSGGYAVSKRIPELQPDVLVLWGRNDEIVECKNAEKLAEDLPHSRYNVASNVLPE